MTKTLGILLILLNCAANAQTGYPPPAPDPRPVHLAFNKKKLAELEAGAYSGKKGDAAILAARASLLYGNEQLQMHWLTVGIMSGDPDALHNYWPFVENENNEMLLTARKRFVYWAFQKHSSKWSAEDKQDIIDTYKDDGIILK